MDKLLLLVGVVIALVGARVWYKERKWAYLYKNWGCEHCHTNPCQCGRCPACNHHIGFCVYPGAVCGNCGWRAVRTENRYHGDPDPAYPGQGRDVDYTGLDGGGGGYGHGA